MIVMTKDGQAVEQGQYYILHESAFILMFMSCAVCILYAVADPQLYMLNMIMLNIVFLIAIVTYFSTLTTGLILNILFIFVCCVYTWHDVWYNGDLNIMQNSFWMIMAPVLTGVIWMLKNANRKLKEENQRLVKLKGSIPI